MIWSKISYKNLIDSNFQKLPLVIHFSARSWKPCPNGGPLERKLVIAPWPTHPSLAAFIIIISTLWLFLARREPPFMVLGPYATAFCLSVLSIRHGFHERSVKCDSKGNFWKLESIRFLLLIFLNIINVSYIWKMNAKSRMFWEIPRNTLIWPKSAEKTVF